MILFPWMLTVLFLFSNKDESAEQNKPSRSEITHRSELTQKGNSGPWGDLTYTRVLIEPPEDHLEVRFSKNDHFIWIFQDYDEAQLNALWAQAELTSAELDILDQPGVKQIEDRKIKITAPKDFVRTMNRKARTVIYTALSKFPENNPQSEPFRFNASRRDEWFEGSELKPESISAISSMFYERGKSVLFSDTNFMMGEIGTAEQRLLFLKTLARTSTMLVTVQIKPDTDIDTLSNYWGQGPRAKDIQPLLQSLQRKRTAVAIDIIHFLPPFARSLLYTYPSTDDPGSKTYKDCHWTSLNFFKTIPDPRYEDISEIITEITEQYHPISGAPKFGDLILFVADKNDVIHSCVYIADDIVFTKNGVNPSTPWILMSLEDVIANYPSDIPLDIQRYRRKTTANP